MDNWLMDNVFSDAIIKNYGHNYEITKCIINFVVSIKLFYPCDESFTGKTKEETGANKYSP